MKLTFEEFRKLSRHEQNTRYNELSKHDKLLARMNDSIVAIDQNTMLVNEVKEYSSYNENLLQRIKQDYKDKE